MGCPRVKLLNSQLGKPLIQPLRNQRIPVSIRMNLIDPVTREFFGTSRSTFNRVAGIDHMDIGIRVVQLTNRTLMEPPYRGLMEPAEGVVFRVSDGVIFSCFSGF